MKTGTILSEKHNLFNDLPKDLKYELAVSMYEHAVDKIQLLKFRDKALIVRIIPLMRPLHLNDKFLLYQ